MYKFEIELIEGHSLVSSAILDAILNFGNCSKARATNQSGPGHMDPID